MTTSRHIIAAIEAALDTDTEGEYLMDHIASHLRPRPWEQAEDRVRLE